MAEPPSFTTFVGDGEYKLCLPPELIEELERKLNAGIGGIAKRLFSSDFRHAEITETIRLALIGGGERPQTAAALVSTYIAPRPIIETLPLAIATLETVWFGRPQQDDEGKPVNLKDLDHLGDEA